MFLPNTKGDSVTTSLGSSVGTRTEKEMPKDELLKKFFEEVLNYKVVNINFDSDINAYYLLFKNDFGAEIGKYCTVLTYEEAVKVQMEHEECVAFKDSRWYSPAFLANLLEVPTEKVIRYFSDSEGKNDIYGEQLEKIVMWELGGKDQFIRKLSEKSVKDSFELCDGVFSFLGEINRHLVYERFI